MKAWYLHIKIAVGGLFENKEFYITVTVGGSDGVSRLGLGLETRPEARFLKSRSRRSQVSSRSRRISVSSSSSRDFA